MGLRKEQKEVIWDNPTNRTIYQWSVTSNNKKGPIIRSTAWTGDRQNNQGALFLERRLKGSLTDSEMQKVVDSYLKNNKAPGPDKFQGELIKTMTQIFCGCVTIQGRTERT